MRVAGVDVERARVIPVAISMRGGGVYEAAIVELSAGGLSGYGEAPALPGRGAGLDVLVAELSGLNPPAAAAARSARETALLDLEGKARGLRVVDLLGGARRDGVVCSAMVGPDPAPAVAVQVEDWTGRGFRTFKLKSANQGGPVDLERLGAARWASGREGRLRLDFNAGLTFAQAGSVLPSLARFGLELAEQPLPAAAEAASWRALATLTGIPLAADESLADPQLAGELASAGLGLAIKLATVGGPRAAIELARAASGPVTFGSSYETSVGLAAALHAACAATPEPLDCGLATAGLFETGVARGLVGEGPRLALPPGPGLGVEPDLELLEFYRVER